LKTTCVLAAVILSALPSLFADTVVLVALPSEQSALSGEVRIVGKSVELAQHTVSMGYRKGEKVYIIRTGAGIVNAAMTAQAVLTRYKVDRVISIGVAGNLNDGWKVGDILIATDVVNHQQGKETPAGFEVKKERSAISRQLSVEYLQKCGELRKVAIEITTDILRQSASAKEATADKAQSDRKEEAKTSSEEPNAESRTLRAAVREGRLVSGDSFIASSAKRKWLCQTFKADAVDMVSDGIARVCEANGVPYVIIRALSDNADESASAAFAAFVQKYNHPITAEIAIRLIDGFAAGSQTPSH
jgi:adenosylhomocysteine nucleosidase